MRSGVLRKRLNGGVPLATGCSGVGAPRRKLHNRRAQMKGTCIPVTNWNENHAMMRKVGKRTEDSGLLRRNQMCASMRACVRAWEHLATALRAIRHENSVRLYQNITLTTDNFQHKKKCRPCQRAPLSSTSHQCCSHN